MPYKKMLYKKKYYKKQCYKKITDPLFYSMMDKDRISKRQE